MENYLEDVLKRFIPRGTKVEVDHYTEDKVDFLIVDMDLDDEAEIMIVFKQQGEEYLGMLKRKGGFWRLREVLAVDEDETMLSEMLEPIVDDGITTSHVGETYKLYQLFGEGPKNFICLEGKRSYFCRTNPALIRANEALEVIDFKQADVFGDGTKADIYLLGSRVFGEINPQIQNLTLRVVSCHSKEELEVGLTANSGYSPRLIVEDFTGDLAKDIMVTSYTNPGGYIFTEIYHIQEDELEQIFSTETFNEVYTGLVEYKDNYRVEVSTEQPGKVYSLDLTMMPSWDLEKLYDENQKLRQRTEGTLIGTISVNVVDYDHNGIYDLAVVQRILGEDNLQNLGLVETFMKWNIGFGGFVPYMQYVSLQGMPKV
ncbi:MAG: hypothetical protein ACRCW2_08105 [Cellulosilyticaceae bacterium]